MTAQEHPEPVEPTMASVPGGIYCLVHGTMDCTEPFCWKCGNHQMDDFERCADPRCRATNDEMTRRVVARVKESWSRPVPLEILALEIGEHLRRWMPRAYDDSPSSLPVGDSGAVQADDPLSRPVPG